MLRLVDGIRAENQTAAAFNRLSVGDLLRVQKVIHELRSRYCVRIAGPAGRMVAEVLDLDATADRRDSGASG